MLIYRAFSILGRTLNSRRNVWRRSRPLETLQTPPRRFPLRSRWYSRKISVSLQSTDPTYNGQDSCVSGSCH